MYWIFIPNLLLIAEKGGGFEFFFNYANYCYLSYFYTYFAEFFLIIYIIYIFLNFKNNLQPSIVSYFQYLCFLFVLLGFLIIQSVFFELTSLVSLHLLNTIYLFYCKIFLLLLLISILMISKKKLIHFTLNFNFKDLSCIFSFLILFIFILFSAFDFFVIYLTIEGISIILYTLGSLMNRSLLNLEAIIKYFLINNMASSFLLWSISYLFILTETTDCFELQYLLISSLEGQIIHKLYNISFFLLLSIFFKLAMFPMHWWIVDIYEGLWTPITLCYSTLIKVTYFLFFFKLLFSIFYPILFLFQPFFCISAVGSVTLGSLGALVQVRIKRFIGYTSIAQSGYILVGLACNTINGAVSSFLYLFMYSLVTLSFFLVLLNIENINKQKNITYLNELYSLLFYNKEITFHFLFIFLIMAAIPPFSSFFSKVLIFIVSIEAKLEILTFSLLGLSLLNTFYYLNFVQQLVFFKANKTQFFIFKENLVLFTWLRLNTFFFTFSLFFITNMYNSSWFFLTSCFWPISY